MCDDLGVQIYAEGVECKDTYDALLEIVLSIHQRFLHGKAIPVADFAGKSMNSKKACGGSIEYVAEARLGLALEPCSAI